MNPPDARTFAEQLVMRINAATAPTRVKVAELRADVAELRAQVAELRGEIAAMRQSERKLKAVASVARPRSAA